MMAYEGSESTQDNFGKFINQFKPETKTLIGKLERIVNKLDGQNLSLLFNETCLYIHIIIFYVGGLEISQVDTAVDDIFINWIPAMQH